jgi:hypothetical protein
MIGGHCGVTSVTTTLRRRSLKSSGACETGMSWLHRQTFRPAGFPQHEQTAYPASNTTRRSRPIRLMIRGQGQTPTSATQARDRSGCATDGSTFPRRSGFLVGGGAKSVPCAEYPKLCVCGSAHADLTGHLLNRSGYRIAN